MEILASWGVGLDNLWVPFSHKITLVSLPMYPSTSPSGDRNTPQEEINHLGN